MHQVSVSLVKTGDQHASVFRQSQSRTLIRMLLRVPTDSPFAVRGDERVIRSCGWVKDEKDR